MKRLLILIALLLPAVARAQLLPPDTCIVEGYIYGNDLKPAAGEKVYALKSIVSGYVTTLAKSEFEADSTGFIRMVLFRDSRTWLYGRKVRGLDRLGGVQVPIPDTSWALLYNLIPVEDIPDSYVVAATLSGDVSRYGDSIRVADSLARAALDSLQTRRIEWQTKLDSLWAALDTAGQAERGVIEAEVASLYASLATITGQIATLTSNLASLTSRVDAVEAKNAQQDDTTAAIRADLDAHRNGADPHPQYATDVVVDANSNAISALQDTAMHHADSIRILRQYAELLLTYIGLKLNSDTASIAAVLDDMYSRSGGGGLSLWTDATTHIYRDGAVSIGTTAAGDSLFYVNGGLHLTGGVKVDQAVNTGLSALSDHGVNIASGSASEYGFYIGRIGDTRGNAQLYSYSNAGRLSLGNYQVAGLRIDMLGDYSGGYAMFDTDGGVVIGDQLSARIDGSNLNILANVVQTPDSTARLGTVVTPKLVHDTTNFYSVDSIGNVFVYSLDKPIFLGTGNYGYGEMVFRFIISDVSGTWCTALGIHADSTNNVKIVGTIWEGSGARGLIQGGTSMWMGGGNYAGLASFVGGTTYYGGWPQTFTSYGGSTDGPCNYQHWHFYVKDRPTEMRLTVKYMISPGNTSSQPITITDE